MSDLSDKVDSLKNVIPFAKAHFIGEDGGVQSTALVEQDRQSQIFSERGALTPAYDPNVLALIYENSSSLRPNVDAYITNIDSFGHAFIPTIECDADEAPDRIRDALRIERSRAKLDARNASNNEVLLAADEPTDAEVKERLETLAEEIRVERAMLHAFFENCTYDMPFSGPGGLRGMTRQDIEVLGNGYWEVLRNRLGQVCQFSYIPAISVRMMPIDREITEVVVRRRVSILSTEGFTVRKRFRRYVQVSPGGLDGNIVVFFKEFGDPRVISSKSGKAYPDLQTMEATEEEKGVPQATEILAFKNGSPRTSYGIPRWIGALLAVMGTRQSEEVNFLYFENRSVPPLALLVSGGRLNDDTVKRVESYINNEIKGKRNFHKILILEAESDPGANAIGQTNKMKIEIRPLTDAQQKDALFQAYDERNADKVGQTFRLPRILRGDVRDFNRSTAEASIDFAEIQVFGPIRQEFDWAVNKLIFPALGVKYHTFRSNAPTVRDPEQLSRMVALLTSNNVLTPAEARNLAQDVFNQAFENLKDDWVNKPISITLAELAMKAKNSGGGGGALDDFEEAGGMSTPNAGPTQTSTGVPQKPKTTPPDRSKPKPKSDNPLRAQAKAILKMTKALEDAARADDDEELETEVMKVPAEEFRSWWKTGP